MVIRGQETDYSRIIFSDAAAYNFAHTSNAIITDIYEVTIHEFLAEFANSLQEWSGLYGLKHWETNVKDYGAKLKVNSYRAWQIESAIGFHGFVVAKTVSNA
ncbi:MAG: hypothetical protein JWM78_1751 [Verrucomicrobiaceae bacterium]|nr:hypothetical protein [Verrucomicrobiaceae bacterium]